MQTTLLMAVQSSEIFEIYREQYDKVAWDLAMDMARNVLSEDGQTFQSSVRQIISTVESQLCMEEDSSEDEDCNEFKNWILGCQCKDEFTALEGNCKNTPCEIVQLLKTSGPSILKGIVSAKSYEERFVQLMNLTEQIWRKFCECRGVLGAAINCIKSYNGLLKVMMVTDTNKFDEIVEHLDWETVSEIMQGLLGATCGAHKGEDCLGVFKSWQINGGALLDNSFNSVNTCLSLVRIEDKLENFLVSQIYSRDVSNMTAYVNGIVDAHVSVEESLFCNDDCANQMKDSFYFSCCIKRAGEALSTEEMKENFTKLFENLWTMLYTGTVPDFHRVVNKVFSICRPAGFCGNKTSVYTNMDNRCDSKGN